MSFEYMAYAVKQKVKSPISKLVLLMLANYADENGRCYPSQKHLAKICHVSRQSINKYIKDLEQSGLITITKKSNGLLVHNEYVINKSNVKDVDNASTNVNLADRVCQPALQNTINNTINIYTSNFEVFWKEVPKKVSKAQSKKIYEKLIKDKVITESELTDKMKEYAEYVKGKDPKYILHPSTWLNQRRWEDDIKVENRKVDYEKNWLM